MTVEHGIKEMVVIVTQRGSNCACWRVTHSRARGEVLKENDKFITVLAYREKPQSKVKLEHYAITILKCTIVERKQSIPKP